MTTVAIAITVGIGKLVVLVQNIRFGIVAEIGIGAIAVSIVGIAGFVP